MTDESDLFKLKVLWEFRVFPTNKKLLHVCSDGEHLQNVPNDS